MTPESRRLAGGALLVVSLGVVVVAAGVLGWILDTVDEERGLAHWDESAAEWAAANVSDRAADVLGVVTELGGTTPLVVALAAAGAIEYVRHRRTGVFGYLAVVGGGVLVVNNVLKASVERERPDVGQLVGWSGASFPSGHTASAAACWAAIALVLTRRSSRSVRAAAGVGAATVALVVALTRVVLGVHWFTDVAAGLVVGWAWFALVTLIFGGRTLRLGEPVEHVADAVTHALPSDDEQVATR